MWQINDEDWKGEFVDVRGGKEKFPDRAVLKALLTGDQDVVVGSVSTKLVVNILIGLNTSSRGALGNQSIYWSDS